MAVSINGNTGVVTGLAALPDSAMASGSIIQVVSTTKTDTFTTTAAITSPAAVTGLSCSITPSSSSNKILIMVNIGSSSCTNGDFAARFHYTKEEVKLAEQKEMLRVIEQEWLLLQDIVVQLVIHRSQ